MKKMVLRLMSAALALIMALSLAACGGTPASSSAPESSSKTSSVSEPESKPESSESSESSAESKAEGSGSDSSAADGTYPTVTAFMEDNRDLISASIEQIAGDQDEMEISLDCTDDSLIYKFVFTESAMAEVDESALISALEEQIDDESFTTTFKGIADSIKSVVPQQNTVKVEVVYSKADGAELVHRTYTSGS